MNSEVMTLNVCVDCLYATEYGIDELGEGADIEAVRAGLDQWAKTSFSVDYSEPAHFSWSPCEMCRSSLGGDRIKVNALRH